MPAYSQLPAYIVLSTSNSPTSIYRKVFLELEIRGIIFIIPIVEIPLVICFLPILLFLFDTLSLSSKIHFHSLISRFHFTNYQIISIKKIFFPTHFWLCFITFRDFAKNFLSKEGLFFLRKIVNYLLNYSFQYFIIIIQLFQSTLLTNISNRLIIYHFLLFSESLILIFLKIV